MTDCKMDCEGRIKVAVISAAKPDEVAKSYQDYFGYQAFLKIVNHLVWSKGILGLHNSVIVILEKFQLSQSLHADFHCCWVFFLACICKLGTLFDAEFSISLPPQ